MRPSRADCGGGNGVSRRRLVAAAGALGATVLAGCTGDGGDGSSGGSSDGGSDGGDGAMAAAWRTTELTEVRGGETFTIDSLEPPVVVQSFAVWCPTCQRQSEQLAAVADSLTVVGLNTDPNEDAEKVRQHAADNGFDWRFAVAPTAMTESLIDAFGTTVTNAPSTPLVFVCGDGSAEFVAGNVRTAAEIETTAGDC
jgi:thiol-disulfide isomerase/thioredoxin